MVGFSLMAIFLLPFQNVNGNGHERRSLTDSMVYEVSVQVSATAGDNTPLWINANKHGLSSLENGNGYVRASLSRPLSVDSERRWGVGYGVDLVGAVNYNSAFIVQQAYVEGRWLHGVLTAGSKQWAAELKNNELSSGAQTLGINARPVPQLRLALPEYWSVPFTNGWLSLKGHIAYGMTTDGDWQEDFTSRRSKYTTNTFYHSKAGYIKIGKNESHVSMELGLEMAAQFGGTSYIVGSDGTIVQVDNSNDFNSFVNAFVPGGADAVETTYQNSEGNQLGSWLARLNFEYPSWSLGLYADHFFEDHSQMFLLDYDGYGSGHEWNVRKDKRYLLYSLKDMMLGVELNLKHCSWTDALVVEYLYSKYQSGPIYHDHNSNIPDHIGGVDNYYNHYIFSGWQHWGQVIGNPLYRSPIYNDDGTISVKNSRFMAFHMGIDGRPAENITYRLLGTWQEGLGTYAMPYTGKRHNVSFMAEATYSFAHDWKVRGAYAMDFGRILGNNAGFQLTVSKSGWF